MELKDEQFLRELVNELDHALNHSIHLTDRIGFGEDEVTDRVDRIPYVTIVGDSGRTEDTDQFATGFAPIAKLLHAAILQLAKVNLDAGRDHIRRWKSLSNPLWKRLWAAAALTEGLADADEVGAFLIASDEDQFWYPRRFPEIAELRAQRFGDLPVVMQAQICKRLLKLEPKGYWSKWVTPEDIQHYRIRRAAVELRRIEVAGHILPPKAGTWLDAHRQMFPELADMPIYQDFPEDERRRTVWSDPEVRYGGLHGNDLLTALETALAHDVRYGEDSIPRAARDWLQEPDHLGQVLTDMGAGPAGGDTFPHLWNQIGWAHTPSDPGNPDGGDRNLQQEADLVLGCLRLLTQRSIAIAIDGISHWLSRWTRQIILSPRGLEVWLKVWPVAVAVANAERAPILAEEFWRQRNEEKETEAERARRELASTHSPVGRMVAVMIDACSDLTVDPKPLAPGKPARIMRDAMDSADGRAEHIIQDLLLQHASYFLRADHDWATEHIVAPLLRDDDQALVLWEGASRIQGVSRELLKEIGPTVYERVADDRLSRNTWPALMQALVGHLLWSWLEGEEPVVSSGSVQQALRRATAEVRSSTAHLIWMFQSEAGGQSRRPNEKPQKTWTAADVFAKATKPFLDTVWPQERSLMTPGISSNLARLPAACGSAFAEAVSAIERLLVPFECWALADLGFFTRSVDHTPLAIVDTAERVRLC